MTAVPGAYAQLLSLGVLWTSFHCAGMCGPLLIGLDVAGIGRRDSAWRGALQILTYQAGRGLTYAGLGGLCGLLGAGLNRGFGQATALLAMAMGVLSIGVVARRQSRASGGGRPILLRQTAPPSLGQQLGSMARQLLSELVRSRAPLRSLALGAAMGFLPCMIAFWALGLAALTGSALHGALVMLLLVAMTTPGLLVLTLLPRLGLWPRRGGALAAYLPAVSGVWLLLVGAAGLGLVPHLHHGVTILGRPFQIMFF